MTSSSAIQRDCDDGWTPHFFMISWLVRSSLNASSMTTGLFVRMANDRVWLLLVVHHSAEHAIEAVCIVHDPLVSLDQGNGSRLTPDSYAASEIRPGA